MTLKWTINYSSYLLAFPFSSPHHLLTPASATIFAKNFTSTQVKACQFPNRSPRLVKLLLSSLRTTVIAHSLFRQFLSILHSGGKRTKIVARSCCSIVHASTSSSVSGKSDKTKGMAGTYANGTHENTMDNEKGEEDGMSLYERAIYRLNCLQSNAITIAKNQQNRQRMVIMNVQETTEFLQKLGITLDDIDQLNIVHITGTKGKGSTAAFLESILRSFGYKTGLYSSPHLVHARERIRINGQPISEQYFAEHFFRVYDTLTASLSEGQSMPAYFKFLTLLAFHCFRDSRVDVAIVEVGIGGEYDCTNTVRQPIVCAITTLDLDHTKLLGNSIPEIAWHKAGIAKPGSILLSMAHSADAMKVIQRRCQERKCSLWVVPSTLAEYKWPEPDGIKLGIQGIHHHINVSMALQLARIWLHKIHRRQPTKNPDPIMLNDWHEEKEEEVHGVLPKQLNGFPISPKIAEALAGCRWPGRSQLFRRGNVLFHLDGAHTPQSIQYCAQWFQQASFSAGNDILRLLIFHCTGDRESAQLLPKFMDCRFNLALFCPAQLEQQPAPLSRDNTNLNVDPQLDMRRCEHDIAVWKKLLLGDMQPTQIVDENGSMEKGLMTEENGVEQPSHMDEKAFVFPSISEAISYVDQLALNNGKEIHVLVTGSFHLVGGVLSFLDPETKTI